MYANGSQLLCCDESQSTAATDYCLCTITAGEIVLCEHQEMDGNDRRLV